MKQMVNAVKTVLVSKAKASKTTSKMDLVVSSRGERCTRNTKRSGERFSGGKIIAAPRSAAGAAVEREMRYGKHDYTQSNVRSIASQSNQCIFVSCIVVLKLTNASTQTKLKFQHQVM